MKATILGRLGNFQIYDTDGVGGLTKSCGWMVRMCETLHGPESMIIYHYVHHHVPKGTKETIEVPL